ncbi:mRNA stability protein [Mycena kentingensis (nom. inval.)]|nr:mRNA stability protein [Mycena kentingensis (nom. inval.)]
MLPAQRNKVDMSNMNEQEKLLFAKYGKLPTHKNVLMKMQKDRKYFDSGDYALSKAGVAPQNAVGTAIPHPENIPHATATSPPPNGSPHPTLSISPVGTPKEGGEEPTLMDSSSSSEFGLSSTSSPPNTAHSILSPTNPTSPLNQESTLAYDSTSMDTDADGAPIATD